MWGPERMAYPARWEAAAFGRRAGHRGAICSASLAFGAVVAIVAMAGFWGVREVRAQDPPPTTEHAGEIEGVVRDAETEEPLAGAYVLVVGTRTIAVTHGDGTFHLTGIEAGEYALRVERLGYLTRTIEVIVGRESEFVLLEMSSSPIALQGMVVTASLSAHGTEEALRPVNVLAGDELQRRLHGTLAATLASEPGLAATSMGPATARPVIRGLSGDRVLLLEDGARVGDVSSTGPDHATALEASSARRIEVVRGPAALLYGSNALGGVVNVIRDEIPDALPHHPTGAVSFQAQTVNRSASTSATTVARVTDRLALRAEVTGRTSGDLNTPVGTLENTSGDSWVAGAGAAYVTTWGHLGGSFRSYSNDYGIPGGFVGGHEAGVGIETDRMSTKVRTLIDKRVGRFESVKVDGTYTWYRLKEIEPPDILATVFVRETASGDFLARHDRMGPFAAGVLGARVSWEDFGFGGALATPNSRRSTLAGYVFEEIHLDPVRIETGVRYDWVLVDPLQEDLESDIGEIRDRKFGAMSGSLGILYRTEFGLTLGSSVSRAFRTPGINELYSEGPHLAAYVFEVGNPSLGAEIGTGLDIFLRFGGDRLRADLTGFYTDISGYIYGEETGRSSRVQLPVYQFQAGDALFKGFEASLDLDLGAGLAVQGVASHVEAKLRDTGDPLPLIPPFHGRVALEYEQPAWFIRAEAEMAAQQDRIGAFESSTDGYRVFHAGAGVRLTLWGRLNTLTLNLENMSNAEYRNHLSRVKQIMPEAGRGLTLSYRVVF